MAGVVATVLAVTGCSVLLEDKGPLPPEPSGPPLSADSVVRDLTSAFSGEGVALERMSQDLIALECQEYLSAEVPAATAEAALKSGFGRARSEHGWRRGPDMGKEWLTLRKGNWTAATSLSGAGAGAAGSATTTISISVLCDDSRGKRPSDAAPSDGAPSDAVQPDARQSGVER
jgi:hypothetical protein